jgi:hypothetical protein
LKAKFDVLDHVIRVSAGPDHEDVIVSLDNKATSSSTVIPLTPTVARAIASAIMGAASEAHAASVASKAPRKA